MPFKLQGSSMLVIQPCYDGRTLPITHQMAADGLALLSIKDSHHDCTVTRDPTSKLPALSCNRGIKPRNSFWNVHKPELRKIKGLDCKTTDNVVELFQSHNIENGGVLSYGKKVVSKLGSLINKKSKPIPQPQLLLQNVSWPINCCILSSICQETEVLPSDVQKKEETERTLTKYDFERSNKIQSAGLNEDVKDTVFITHPQSIMHENTSDDLIPVTELLNPSTGDSSSNTLRPFNTGSTRVPLGYDGAVLTSSILLENKQSQHQISIPSNVEFSKENALKETCVLKNCEKNKIDVGDITNQDKVNAESPSASVVQSIFSDIFQDIEEIKDVINSYMSSFYVQEEEYNNFPKANTPSKEVTSHFYEQIHGPSKDKNCNLKNMHSTVCHSFQKNSGNQCMTEQCHREDSHRITMSEDVKVQKNTFHENNLENVNKNEAEKERNLRYCYWEDNDLDNEFLNDQAAGKIENNIETPHNNAVVTQEFIENMWEEFINQVETHALFMDLINENEMKKSDREMNFPSYGHWSNMYDPNIFQEAENIVYTLDSLLTNGCFPEERGNRSYIPCTIVELVDESELDPGFADRSSENGEKLVNRDGNITTKQEYQATTHDNKTYSVANTSESVKLNDPSGSERIKRRNNNEYKLEPVFYQEKMVLHEVEYSRVPEYEKIQLQPINHAGRVDFSPLQANDLTRFETKEFEIVGQTNKHIIPTGNLEGKENSITQPITEVNDNLSDPRFSVFEKFQDRNGTENPNSAFLFSSPAVQINLTSPTVNTNKK